VLSPSAEGTDGEANMLCLYYGVSAECLTILHVASPFNEKMLRPRAARPECSLVYLCVCVLAVSSESGYELCAVRQG